MEAYGDVKQTSIFNEFDLGDTANIESNINSPYGVHSGVEITETEDAN